MAVDEYRLVGWRVTADGTLVGFSVQDGRELLRRRLTGGRRPTAIAADTRQGTIAFGFGDGSIRLGRAGFSSRSLDARDLPRTLRDLRRGDSAVFEGGVLGRSGGNELVVQRVETSVDDPIPGDSSAPVLLLDLALRGDDPVFAAYTGDGVLRLYGLTRRTNLLTGKVTASLSGGSFPVPRRPGQGHPAHVKLSGVADTVYLLWSDGHMVRVDTRDFAAPRLAETAKLLTNGEAVTSAAFLIGRATLLVGDSTGQTTAWFRVKPPDADSPDGAVLVAARRLPGGPAPVTALAPSARTRAVAVGYGDGAVRIYQVTSGRLLATAAAQPGKPIAALALAPKGDGLAALADGRFWAWAVNIPHPEVSVGALFGSVWYEGYPRPEHVWQSSSGTDDFEPKLGLMPLVFGTLKAVLYSMLFSVPAALLAALYTSEFLSRRAKARVKPAIEMMASLPSVVLGFVAALVFAPFVEDWVPHLLTAFFAVPFVLLLGAHLWQLLPPYWLTRLASRRLAFVALALPFGLAGAALAGGAVERLFFAGDIKLWLDGQAGSGVGGWMLLTLPASAIVAGYAIHRAGERLAGARLAGWSPRRAALFALGKFAAGTVAAALLAWALSWALGAAGFDPRGGFLATYVQRNALIVGFVMGIAVIPVIYTIAEDALSAVPDHLRSASLAAGATPWQTARRIVIPTAMSGLFSAVMIGFGRAVGETMVVLMAAGNTPVMEWNMFNGFRTLSANIAVELPEAVRDSTHYRTLFLSALVLFVMTFAVNTLAEFVRQRFRKRAYEL
jgi:phosphate transport system permease protein